MKKIVFILFVLVSVVSCKHKLSSDVKENKLYVNNKITLDNKIYYLEISDIDSQRIILSIKGEYFYVSVDKKTHTCKKIVKKGKGPNEFLFLFWVNNTHHKILFFDIYNKKIFEFENKHQITKIMTMNIGKNTPFNIVEVDSNTYISSGTFHKGRFGIIDGKGNLIKETGYYPIKDSLSIDNYSFGDFCQSKLKSKPDKPEVIASIIPFSEIFEIFKYDKKTNILNRISKTETNNTLEYNETKTFPKYISKKESIIGYISMSVTQKYIYVLFNKNTLKDYLKDMKKLFCNEVRVFDWKGNMVKKYFLEKGALSIYVFDNKLYTLGLDKDYHSVIYIYKI